MGFLWCFLLDSANQMENKKKGILQNMFFSFPLKKERLKGLEGIVHIWKKYFIIFGLYYFQILKQILRKTIYFYYSKVAMTENVIFSD